MKQWTRIQFMKMKEKPNMIILFVFMLISLSLSVPFTSPAQAACNWTGTWELTGAEATGIIQLEQNGNQVVASGGDEADIGTVSGDTVRFPWISESSLMGYKIFTMQSDCNHFTVSCEFTDPTWPPCQAVGDGVRVDVPNQPPEVTLSYYPILPVAGKLITFSADASDPDGDELVYEWYLNGVQQAGTSSEFQWPKPSVGMHSARVVVSDNKGGKEEDSVEVTVNEAKRYIIAPGLQEKEGEPWGGVGKIWIDGKEVTDAEKPKLYTGSQIKTGPGVVILIWVTGGGVTKIFEDTQYEVKVVEYNEPNRKEAYGRLFQGIIDFYWPPNNEIWEKFHVESKRARVGIKGTTFTVSHIFDITTVEVEDGVVEVTDLDTDAVSIIQAGERLSFGENCLSIGDDLGISLSSAEYDEIQFSFDLDYYPNPSDPSNLYWKMDLATLKAVMDVNSIPIGGDLGITIPCAEYSGVQYTFKFDYYYNPADPSGLYWKMDLITLSVVQRGSTN